MDARLIVELDGGHHGEPEHESADALRAEVLELAGYLVIRFWNADVMFRMDMVLEVILENVVAAGRRFPYGTAN